MDTAALDAAAAATEQQAVDQQNQAVADLKWQMGTKQGRRFVWRLLAEAGVYRTSFHTNGSMFACNEGRKQIGLMLIGEINVHCPDSFVLMMKENAK
jgi:hypothetical protein